jgi:integral membrane protein
MSLIILVFVGMLFKYFMNNPSLVKSIGPVHGALFLVFVFTVIKVSIQRDWKFFGITLKLLLSSFVPFGCFYVDKTILKPMQD